MADLQRCDAEALCVVERHPGNDPAAVVAQRPLGVQLAIEAGRDGTAVIQAGGRALGQAALEQVEERRVDREGGDRERGSFQGRHDRAGRLQCRPDRPDVARGAPPCPQPTQRAQQIRHAAQRCPQSVERDRVVQQPFPAILPAGDLARVQQRARQPLRQQPCAGCRQRPIHRGHERVRTAVSGITRAGDLEARPGRGIEHHLAGKPRRHRPRQPRQVPGLRQSDVIQRHGGGDHLGVAEHPERLQAGRAERFGDPRAGCDRCRRHDDGAALGRPLAEVEALRRQDLRRLQLAQQGGQIAGTGRCGFEQPGRDIEPRHAQTVPQLRDRQQQVGPVGLEQAVLGQRAWRHQPDDLSLERPLAGTTFGHFHLLGHRHPKAAPDQARQVGLGRMHGHAAHRDLLARMLTALGQHDVQRAGGRLRIGEEQFVEIAHPQEQ